MTTNVWALGASILVALASSGLIVALLTLRPQRAKMGAEATSMLTCASANWVARVQESAEKALLRAEHAEQDGYKLRRIITDQQNRIDLQDAQMRRLLRHLRAADVDLPADLFGPPTIDPIDPTNPTPGV